MVADGSGISRIGCLRRVFRFYYGKIETYEEWRNTPVDRAEDAAKTFGYHLMAHCRAEAMKKTVAKQLPATLEELEKVVGEAVDTALHNVTALLEGFWPTDAGPNHRVEYALSVVIKDKGRKVVERIDISPCLIDLPIGYWNWRDGDFR